MTIFAGINGAGKSTLYSFQKHIGDPNLGVRICPDEILLDFNGNWKSNRDIARSGTITIKKIHECIEEGFSFNWETTTIGFLTLKFLTMAKEKGFETHLNFIGVEDVELSIKRIKERVLNGGHGVPEDMVRLKHSHQFLNMDKTFPLLDTAMFYDNANCMEVVGTYHKNKLNIYNHKFNWVNGLQESFQKSLNPEPNSIIDVRMNNDDTISGM